MPPPDYRTALTFGGGLNSRRRVADVDINECVQGSENFDLDPQFRALIRRRPFDLVATAPNSESIQGFAQLVRVNGAVSTLVQAGGNVYSWDGDSTFSLEGTVAASAKLRGPREHNFTLSGWVIITDLAKLETVKKWDGTAFAEFNHDLGGDLIAKYCRIEDERAWLANIQTTTDTPHVVLASQIGNSEVLSASDRPSDSLGFDAPFFLIAPDLRPINGIEEAFGNVVFSTNRGRLFKLTGSDARDFNLQKFYQGSAVVGDEAIKNVGNDIALGLQGRIESLSGTERFGDVETDDLSSWIKPQVEDVTGWTIEYDRRLQKIYCFPNNQSSVYVAYKGVLADPLSQGLSPWSKWTTEHPLEFRPTTVMALIDPISLQDAVYMGDSSGNIYRLDGSGAQDGGSSSITTTRRSGLFSIPEGNTWDIRGYIEYRKLFPTTVTIRILGGGVAVYEQEIMKQLPQAENIAVYGGPHWYGDQTSTYGVSFSARLHRQDFRIAGQASHFQVEIEITSDEDYDIEEVGIAFDASETGN